MAVATLFKLGSVGNEIAEVQARLRALGFDPGAVDGDFGPMTEQAVLAFQLARGLSADGVVGPETREALGVSVGDPAPPSQASSLLVQLGLIAEQQFGLHVGECDAVGAPARWAPVGPGHAEHSFHKLGRAFDASGPKSSTDAFAAFVDANHAASVAELIHKPNGSVKNGQRVSPDFWGSDTFDAHSHCHVAV